jgi:hypothetical protein
LSRTTANVRFSARRSGVVRLPLRHTGGDGCGRKEVSIIVASIVHDIWLGCTLALASLTGLVAVVLAVSRRFREEEL